MSHMAKLKGEFLDILERKDIDLFKIYRLIKKHSLANKEKDFVTSRDGVELNEEVDFDRMETILTLEYRDNVEFYGASVNPNQFQAILMSPMSLKDSDEEGARKWALEAADGTNVYVTYNYSEYRYWKETYRKKEGKWYKVWKRNPGLEARCLSPGIWFYAGIRQDVAKDLGVEFDDDFQVLFDHVFEYIVKT